MPPVRMRGDGRMAKDPKKTFFRLLRYLKHNSGTYILVLLCIVTVAVTQTASSTALGALVDDFILPMVEEKSTDFAPLWNFLVKIACIFFLGMVGSFLQSYLMVGVTQGIQKTIRDETFTKMQRLPIRYFDSNIAGNIMSRFTSDIDTLRQMISQAIPQCITSAVTIIVEVFAMLFTSPILTGVVIISVLAIFFITAKVAGRSAKFFIGQQRALGAVNGYVEEMVNGQRVVKVFCHEDKAKEEFDKRKPSALISRVTADAGQASQTMRTLSAFITSVYSLVRTFMVLYKYSHSITYFKNRCIIVFMF